MVSHALCCAHIKRPIFWKLPGISYSGTMITFSQGVQQKSTLSSFQSTSLAPGLKVYPFEISEDIFNQYFALL